MIYHIFWLLEIMLRIQFLCGCLFFSSLGCIPKCETAGSYDNFIFKILRNYQTVFQSGCLILTFPLAVYEDFLHHHQCLLFICVQPSWGIIMIFNPLKFCLVNWNLIPLSLITYPFFFFFLKHGLGRTVRSYIVSSNPDKFSGTFDRVYQKMDNRR